MILRLARSCRSLSSALVVVSATLLSIGPASAFRSARFTPEAVVVVTDDGGEIGYTPRSFGDEGVTGFSGFAISTDHRYVGWETEQAAIPNAAPVALGLGLVIIGPQSRLEIGSGQQIHAWHFLPDRRVQICTGPTHGDASDACIAYTLPE